MRSYSLSSLSRALSVAPAVLRTTNPPRYYPQYLVMLLELRLLRLRGSIEDVHVLSLLTTETYYHNLLVTTHYHNFSNAFLSLDSPVQRATITVFGFAATAYY